jgi:uncharacterized protein YciI
MHYILFYDVVEDYLERRGEFREEHLGLASRAHDDGKLILAGAYASPADGAALVFRVDDVAEIESFVQSDPYVVNGLVREWRIREWTVVIGD